MNDWPKSQEVQPLKTWEKQTRELKSTSVWDNVIYIKDRLAKIEEEQAENNITVKKFMLLIENYYTDWYATLTDEDKHNFEECCEYIWTEISNLQHKKEYYLKLLLSSISSLSAKERFDKTLMMFVINPWDSLTKLNLKRSVIELTKAFPNIPLYSILLENFEIITEVTQSMLTDNMLEVDILYLRQIYDNLPI